MKPDVPEAAAGRDGADLHGGSREVRLGTARAIK
jgi:hypothetical protein